MAWREYHDLTKHITESLRRTRRGLHWANMPNPFRHYEGVPVLDLPADPPAPQTPAIEILRGGVSKTQAGDGAAFLSQLMFYSTSITAFKSSRESRRRGSRWACSHSLRQPSGACASTAYGTREAVASRDARQFSYVRAPGPMQRLVSLTRLWGATRLKVSQELPSLFQIF